MKRYLIVQQGFTLLELVIGITLTLLLLSGLASLFSTSVIIWNTEKSRIDLQQTARIAVDAVMREIRYAQDIRMNHSQSLTITKPNGEMNTFQLGGGLYENTLYIIIDKTKAIPAGGISANPLTENVVTNLVFTPYPQKSDVQAVGITLEVTNNNTGQKQTIQTAGCPWNKPKPLLMQGGAVNER